MSAWRVVFSDGGSVVMLAETLDEVQRRAAAVAVALRLQVTAIRAGAAW